MNSIRGLGNTLSNQGLLTLRTRRSLDPLSIICTHLLETEANSIPGSSQIVKSFSADNAACLHARGTETYIKMCKNNPFYTYKNANEMNIKEGINFKLPRNVFIRAIT